MLRKQSNLNVDEAGLGSCCVVWKVVGTEDAEREYARMRAGAGSSRSKRAPLQVHLQ